MLRPAFFRQAFLTVIVVFVSGCADIGVRQASERIDSVDQYPPKFQTEGYLTAREKLIENLAPEERLPAVRILDMMMEFMVKVHKKCEVSEEVLVRVLPHMVVCLDIRYGQHDSIQASPFAIHENHIRGIYFAIQEYSSCGCCYVSNYPTELYREFWEDIGKLSHLVELERGSVYDRAVTGHVAITDTGLAHLKGTQLKGLYFSCDDQITEAGLAHLAEMPQLQWLSFSGPNPTDTWLEHIKGLTHLQGLKLYGCDQITDTGMENLQGMVHLENLDLSGTKITDAGLTYLSGMTKMQYLYVQSTNITDAGLTHLERLTQLEQLVLLNCEQITDIGIQKLKDALPQCKVIR